MEYFVNKGSIVREIWGKSDTVLFIFGGASAEFALNRAVDWLYFTGRLPADPLGRLFSTVTYARKIVFEENDKALAAIDKITAIHSTVESNRGAKIPAWAYRDVLYMLIHYSISSFEVLERKLSAVEKEDIYNVFYRLGNRMGLEELPATFIEWLPSREKHLQDDLVVSEHSTDLFKQYKKHLGTIRFKILWQSQILVVPDSVRKLLNMNSFSWLSVFLPVYKLAKKVKLDGLIKALILPREYAKEIRELDSN